jgi:hypothetical protein
VVTGRRGLAVTASIAALVLAAPPVPAVASEATAAEAGALAARAADGDQSALDTLRAVDRIDGRPVDLAVALPASVAAPEAGARLRLLAAPPSGPPVESARARRSAADVLATQEFTGRRSEGALHGFFAAIGGGIEWLVRPFAGLLRPLGWLLAAVAIAAALGTLLAVTRARTRRVALREHRDATRGRAAADPAELERRADLAETAGDLEAALRLRFEAGLVRLDRAGAIVLRESTTSGAVLEVLGPSGFDALAASHDGVVYGGREAVEEDLAAARGGWPRVVEEAGRR